MMPGSYRDALGVENRAEIVRMDAVDREGDDRGLVRRGADDAESGTRMSFSVARASRRCSCAWILSMPSVSM
jgi:hypothetical protein